MGVTISSSASNANDANTKVASPEAPKGYKVSDVGVIPADWSVKKLADVAPLQRGFDLPQSQVRPGPFPVVYSNGVMNHHAEAMVNGPGVITGRSGTIGKVHFVKDDFWPHNTALWVTSFEGNDPKFVYYLYAHLNLERFLAGSGVPTLNRNDVHDHLAACPPVDEQRAIAAALSDADHFIAALERLVEKKRDIRIGVGQQLLTAAIRLPGFDADWQLAPIRSLGETYGGLSGKSADDFGCGDSRYVPFLNVLTNVQVDPNAYERVRVGRHEKQNEVRVGDILFNGTSETPDELAMAAVVVEAPPRLFLNSFCFGLRVRDRAQHDPLFLAYTFRGPVGRRLLYALAQGATRYNLSKTEFRRLKLPLPGLSEQRAIAKVLADLDAGIVALSVRLAKVKAIREGMVQALLSGRVRLASGVTRT